MKYASAHCQLLHEVVVGLPMGSLSLRSWAACCQLEFVVSCPLPFSLDFASIICLWFCPCPLPLPLSWHDCLSTHAWYPMVSLHLWIRFPATVFGVSKLVVWAACLVVWAACCHWSSGGKAHLLMLRSSSSDPAFHVHLSRTCFLLCAGCFGLFSSSCFLPMVGSCNGLKP